ncbi:MAG: c-type cytochrome [Caulobacterales bacterium]|nr:c-type cytochrome [Caulobacterales bacterium]
MTRQPWSPIALASAASAAIALAFSHSPPAAAQSPVDPARGRSLYEARCGGCHSLDANRTGPLHRGVVGRPVASVPGYDYSPALRRVGGTWTADRLDAWLQGPQRMAPGAKMYLSVPGAGQRRDIIAYLASTSPARR